MQDNKMFVNKKMFNIIKVNERCESKRFVFVQIENLLDAQVRFLQLCLPALLWGRTPSDFLSHVLHFAVECLFIGRIILATEESKQL